MAAGVRPWGLLVMSAAAECTSDGVLISGKPQFMMESMYAPEVLLLTRTDGRNWVTQKMPDHITRLPVFAPQITLSHHNISGKSDRILITPTSIPFALCYSLLLLAVCTPLKFKAQQALPAAFQYPFQHLLCPRSPTQNPIFPHAHKLTGITQQHIQMLCPSLRVGYPDAMHIANSSNANRYVR